MKKVTANVGKVTLNNAIQMMTNARPGPKNSIRRMARLRRFKSIMLAIILEINPMKFMALQV